LLPETGTSLGWQLSSTGETAADELDLAMKIAEGIAAGRPFVPGTLSITQRKGQMNGTATRFVVPVLGFDPTQSLTAGELPAGSVSPDRLPAGYTPIAPSEGNGTSLEAGLHAAETQTLTRKPRVELPEDDVFGDETAGEPSSAPEAAASAPSDAGGAADDPGGSSSPAAQLKPTKRQLDKLNVLVGTLRDGGHITTEQLWARVASLRNVDPQTMIDLLGGMVELTPVLGAGDDEEISNLGPSHRLSWVPLRNSLTREEASGLIDRLEKFESNVGAA